MQNLTMPMLERVRAEHVIIGSFFHEPGERAAVTEWWAEPSIVFTSHGAWEVRARRGRGDVTPDAVLVNEPAAEHDCAEIDALGMAMLEAVRDVPAVLGAAPRPGERSRVLVQRLRADADARYLDPDLDLVAAALALGLSRTCFVHVFRDLVGVTPYRYVIELRTSHAARLLRGTEMPVTDICFASGFGSVPSFQSARRSANSTGPSTRTRSPSACFC